MKAAAGELLASKYNRVFLPPPQLKSQNFDMLINCTPLGMKGENPLELYEINLPDYVIDLPYSKEKTPLCEICLRENLEYIDGKEFWRLQAKLQIEELSK